MLMGPGVLASVFMDGYKNQLIRLDEVRDSFFKKEQKKKSYVICLFLSNMMINLTTKSAQIWNMVGQQPQ